MAKTAKKNKGTKRTIGGSAGLKGFGSIGSSGSSSSSSSFTGVELDRSKDTRTFYDFMERGGGGDNLSRCAMGYFPLRVDNDDGNTIQLRGVTALKPIKKDDCIIRIPYELALNLGQEGVDPTVPAVELLRDYCETLSNANTSRENYDKVAYYRMLPPYGGDDCMGSTNFFSDEALQELQSPLIVEETLKRRETVKNRFQLYITPNADDFPRWIDGTSVTSDHLLWAVWLVTSRVLTVQGNPDEGKSYRLLIPFLDMCNHDRASSHILTGRAIPGGELKVVAGTAVKQGEAINICYGSGIAGNDRFIQDYGFLDDGADQKAFNIVAQQLLGKRRIVEGVGAGRFLSEPDRAKSIEALRQTTIGEDVERLQSVLNSPSMRAALSYRIGVKLALTRYASE